MTLADQDVNDSIWFGTITTVTECHLDFALLQKSGQSIQIPGLTDRKNPVQVSYKVSNKFINHILI